MPKPNVREQLIDAGLKTFHLHGFNGCAVQDITQAAGVPKGSFYNHFASKEALALEALERFWQSGAKSRLALIDPAIDPVERLRKHFRDLADVLVRDEYLLGCMIGNFSTELSATAEIRDRLAAHFAAWTRSIETCVREAEKLGRINPRVPPAAIAAFLVNAWEGAVLRSKVERDTSPFDHFERVVFASVFN